MKTPHRFAFLTALLTVPLLLSAQEVPDPFNPDNLPSASEPSKNAPELPPPPSAPSAPSSTSPAPESVTPPAMPTPTAPDATTPKEPIPASGATPAQANEAVKVETFVIDPVHSTVGFKVKHLFSYVTGRFSDFSGTVTGDAAKPEEAKVQVEIQTKSINTGEKKRDQHLRSPEFFSVEQFPTMSYKSKRVQRTGEDTAFILGELTLHGVTKDVILQAKFLGKGKGPEGKIHAGWEAKTALKRSDFGLTWSKAVEGTQLVSDDIEIELQIEAVEADQNATTATPPAAASDAVAKADAEATAPTAAVEQNPPPTNMRKETAPPAPETPVAPAPSLPPGDNNAAPNSFPWPKTTAPDQGNTQLPGGAKPSPNEVAPAPERKSDAPRGTDVLIPKDA